MEPAGLLAVGNVDDPPKNESSVVDSNMMQEYKEQGGVLVINQVSDSVVIVATG
jgi:hypothetical protein